METKTKRKGGRPRTNRDDGVIKMDKDLIRMVRVIAVMQNAPMAQALSEIVAEPIRRRYGEMLRGAK